MGVCVCGGGGGGWRWDWSSPKTRKHQRSFNKRKQARQVSPALSPCVLSFAPNPPPPHPPLPRPPSRLLPFPPVPLSDPSLLLVSSSPFLPSPLSISASVIIPDYKDAPHYGRRVQRARTNCKWQARGEQRQRLVWVPEWASRCRRAPRRYPLLLPPCLPPPPALPSPATPYSSAGFLEPPEKAFSLFFFFFFFFCISLKNIKKILWTTRCVCVCVSLSLSLPPSLSPSLSLTLVFICVCSIARTGCLIGSKWT